MSKITGSFLILVLVIFFSSIVYIWQADAEKRNLESQIVSQEEQIANLETQLNGISSPSSNINVGKIKGAAATSTGLISGTVSLSEDIKGEAIIVCATNTRSQQETCLDFIIQADTDSYEFEFEIPQGTYEVYSMVPPSETKMYYSEISTCDDDECTSDTQTKRLLEVIQEETQSDIDISL